MSAALCSPEYAISEIFPVFCQRNANVLKRRKLEQTVLLQCVSTQARSLSSEGATAISLHQLWHVYYMGDKRTQKGISKLVETDMSRDEVEEVSGVTEKLPGEDVASVKGASRKKAQETGLQEEGQQEVEGAYDELSGDEEDEVREEYEDGMQMHHPALWAEIPDDWVPIYRGLNGLEYYRKVCANVSCTYALNTHTCADQHT